MENFCLMFRGTTSNISEFVCVVNMTLQTLIAGIVFPAIFANELRAGAIGVALFFLTSGVIFNLAVLIGSFNGLGNCLNHLQDSLLHSLKIVQNRWNGHWLSKEISSLWNEVSKNLSLYNLENFSGRTDTATAALPQNCLKVLSSERNMQTPEALPTKDLHVQQKVIEQTHSEPTKIASQTMKKSRNFLCIRNGNLPVRSPELFKNKIYLTRRTLINAQDG